MAEGISPDAAAQGAILKEIRVSRGVPWWKITSALEMSEQNVRHYESGRNMLKAMDVPRFARAYGVSPSYLARKLGLLDEAGPEEAPLTPEEEAEFQALLEDRELGLEFATTARSAREWTDEQKRRVIEVIRQIREMTDDQRRP